MTINSIVIEEEDSSLSVKNNMVLQPGDCPARFAAQLATVTRTAAMAMCDALGLPSFHREQIEAGMMEHYRLEMTEHEPMEESGMKKTAVPVALKAVPLQELDELMDAAGRIPELHGMVDAMRGRLEREGWPGAQ